MILDSSHPNERIVVGEENDSYPFLGFIVQVNVTNPTGIRTHWRYCSLHHLHIHAYIPNRTRI